MTPTTRVKLHASSSAPAGEEAFYFLDDGGGVVTRIGRIIPFVRGCS